MGEREAFTVEATGGTLGGWVAGDGAPVLLLHGGPGLSYKYLDSLASELGQGFRVAAFSSAGSSPRHWKGRSQSPRRSMT